MKLAAGRVRPTVGLGASAKGRIRCSELGEDELVAQWLRRIAKVKNVIAGAGDDCAVVRMHACRNLILFKTDSVVERVHFESGARAADVGWKAMARSLSDFAAMSGLPRFA